MHSGLQPINFFNNFIKKLKVKDTGTCNHNFFTDMYTLYFSQLPSYFFHKGMFL